MPFGGPLFWGEMCGAGLRWGAVEGEGAGVLCRGSSGAGRSRSEIGSGGQLQLPLRASVCVCLATVAWRLEFGTAVIA